MNNNISKKISSKTPEKSPWQRSQVSEAIKGTPGKSKSEIMRKIVGGKTYSTQETMLKPENSPFRVTDKEEASKEVLKKTSQTIQLKKEKKEVSGKSISRLSKAADAIRHTKSVFTQGAGNQRTALKTTNFNSYFRLKVLRDSDYWQIADSVKAIADANPEALVAAKADIARGGNCGEHAKVAFDYLRVSAKGETINLSSVEGLDHGFVLIGDISTESDAEIAVSDPWPTAATATLWEDHFAHTSDRAQINICTSMKADGENVKAVIAAGLTLTDEGKEMIEKSLTEEETKEKIDDGLGDWIWDHPNTAAGGKDFEYYYSVDSGLM